MKPQPSFRPLKVIFLMSFTVLHISCGSFETVSYYNDGIYGDEAVASQSQKETSNGVYYKKYFDEKAVEATQDSGGILFTDPNTYSDTAPDASQDNPYQTYSNWGDQTDQINIIVNGYYPYYHGYTPYYNYYYGDIHYRPWWRHRYRSWYGWSYHHYPSYYYGWYGHHSPYYGHYHYPTHSYYYNNYGSGVTYSRTKGRRGTTNSTSASSYVDSRSVSRSEKFSAATSSTSGRSSVVRRDTAERARKSNASTSTNRPSSGFMSRDFSTPRIYQRSDGRKAVSAGGSNNKGSNNYQVKSYRSQNSNNSALPRVKSSNYNSQKSHSTYNPSYSNSRSSSSYNSGRSSSSYSSGRSSTRSSSSGRSSSSRSSSSGRR